MTEGWGLTYDGKNLIASDGSSNIYFLDVNDPSKVVRKIGGIFSNLLISKISLWFRGKYINCCILVDHFTIFHLNGLLAILQAIMTEY